LAARESHGRAVAPDLALDNHNELSASFKALARELAGVKDKEKPEAEKTSGILGLFPGRRG
jgi:hypothetical protein